LLNPFLHKYDKTHVHKTISTAWTTYDVLASFWYVKLRLCKNELFDWFKEICWDIAFNPK
jgi:hypothetical protein